MNHLISKKLCSTLVAMPLFVTMWRMPDALPLEDTNATRYGPFFPGWSWTAAVLEIAVFTISSASFLPVVYRQWHWMEPFSRSQELSLVEPVISRQRHGAGMRKQ